LVANRAAGTIKRIVRHNGANIPARSGVGLFPTVLFAPEDLLLVASSPGRRRKYLDTVLGQISPRYYSALQRYNQALEQRNALLLTATSLTPTEIEVWEEQLAGEGARLIRGRSAFLEAINNALERIYQQLSNDHKKLYLRYVPALNLPGLESLVTEGQLIRLLRQALKQSRSFDMTIKQTSLGPQRDDFIFELDGRPLVEAGSRGEWRSAVLALKIREKQYLENLIKQPAVLLFDDVFSELDPYRRRLLAEQIRGAQCFVTTTELRALGQPFLNAAQVWRVTPGAVTKW
jgi:DNA replication and repair protein RecF